MIARFRQFIEEVRAEMKKVTWSTREELWSATVVVLTSTALLAVFIGMCDVLLSRAVKFFLQ